MLSFVSNTRVYLAAGATDLRKSFGTLAGIVRESLRLDPLSGHLFVFTNSRKNRIKILFWDNTDWWLCAKRLEAGTLAWPVSPTPSIELSSEERHCCSAALICRRRIAVHGSIEAPKTDQLNASKNIEKRSETGSFFGKTSP